MTISPYQVDSVISAYNKQSKLRIKHAPSRNEAQSGRTVDVVSLSQKGADEAEAFKKISYSIIDIILKDKGV